MKDQEQKPKWEEALEKIPINIKRLDGDIYTNLSMLYPSSLGAIKSFIQEHFVPRSLITDVEKLREKVMSGHFGTKNRAELLLTLEDLIKKL